MVYECLVRLWSCKKWWDCTLLCTKCCCLYVNQHKRFTQYWTSQSEEERRKIFGPFCEFLVWWLPDSFSCHWESCWLWKWYVVTKTYKLTDFEFFFVFSHIACRAIPTYRVYWLYDSRGVLHKLGTWPLTFDTDQQTVPLKDSHLASVEALQSYLNIKKIKIKKEKRRKKENINNNNTWASCLHWCTAR